MTEPVAPPQCQDADHLRCQNQAYAGREVLRGRLDALERALRPQEEVRIWIERELEALRPGIAAASSGIPL